MGTAAVVRTAAAGLAACLVAACSPSAEPGWRQVGLPQGAGASSLATSGPDLLVGGALGGARPLLLRVDATGGVHEVALSPSGGYAATADLVALSPQAPELLALGVARGGAHGNQRWTSWQGPLAGPVPDHDQPFATFGGHEAGPLLGIVRPGGRPVVVGSRAGTTGFDAALWTLDGTLWHRHAGTDPQLVSSPDRVLTFRAAAASGDFVLIAGAETGLAGTVRQLPMVWAGSLDGAWRAIPLPVPEELSGATGLAQATSLACDAAACWAAGWARGRPVAWQLDLAAGAARAFLLEGEGGSATDPLAVVALVDGIPAVLPDARERLVAWRCGEGWRTAAGPPGRVAAAIGRGDRLYVVVGEDGAGTLWEGRLDTSAC